MSDGIKALKMPKWGMAMKNGTVVAWLVEEGAELGIGDEIAEIENEKVTGVYESPVEGTLRRRLVNVGDTVPVGALLGVVASASTEDERLDAFVARFAPG